MRRNSRLSSSLNSGGVSNVSQVEVNRYEVQNTGETGELPDYVRLDEKQVVCFGSCQRRAPRVGTYLIERSPTGQLTMTFAEE